MKGKMKRFLSLMLAIMLVFGMVPMDAYATEGTGDEIKIEDNTDTEVNVDEAVAAVQAMMDALADMPADTEAEIDALRAAYAETSGAFGRLTVEQQEQINLACFNEAKAKIDAFDEAKAVESEGEGDDASVPAVTSEEGGDSAATTTYVAQIGGAQYTTLEEAFAAAAENDTITVLTDVVLTDTLTISAGKKVTLNLNGKTISQSKECTASYEMINNQGNLTITGNGKISFTDTGVGDPTFGWGSYTIRNEGTLVVENGTIEHLGEQNSASVAHMYCAIFQYSGSTTINDGKISTPTYRSVRLWKGDMTITGGTFEGQVWVQCVDNSAKLTIEGGTFAPRGVDGSSVFVDNSNHETEFKVTGGKFETKIGADDVDSIKGAITGGTFTEAAKNNTSGVLLAEGFALVKNADGTYCVGKLPEAEDKLPEAIVTEKDPITLDENNYKVWESGTTLVDGDGERPLDIVVNFQATETEEAVQKSKYRDWIADFYVTVTGIKEGTLTADDCYLAGNYGDFGWIVIPMDELKIEEGESYPIVAAYDANLTYKDICTSVKDFTAAIHISDDIIAANPELKIELALKLKNPEGTSEPQTIGDTIIYTVDDLRGKLPEAIVTKKDPITLEKGDYKVWQRGTTLVEGTDKKPLDIVVNFKATEEEVENSKYRDWIADFYVTVTGIKEKKLTADGCYLAGDYGEFGWIVIPMDEFEIEEGESYPIVAAYDDNLTYKDICTSVKDFTAAIHISDDIIAANPELKIELALKLKAPGETSEPQIIGEPIIYTVADLRESVAKIGEKNYVTLEEAIAAANDGDTVTLLADVATEGSYTINKKVVLDLNGKTIAGTDTAEKSFGLINIQPDAQLTINDTDGNGKITLTSTNNRGWNAYSSVISNQQGTLIVNGGTIEHLGGTDMAYGIDNLTNGGSGNATTTINGGKVDSTYFAIRQFANSSTDMNTVTIAGGEVGYVWMQSPNDKVNKAKTIVTAGEVEGICLTGKNADCELNAKVECVGEVYGTMPTGKVLTVVDGYYKLSKAILSATDSEGTETFHATFESAFAVENVTKVTVLDDLEITTTITVPAGKTVTLDLNSKTVTGVPTEEKEYAVIENKGNLTITGGGAVVCDHKLTGSTAYAVNTITNCGTLTIDGVTVENKSTAISQIGYAIDNNSTTGDAVVVIKAGKVKASGSSYYDGIRQFCNSTTSENSVTVENGTVSSIWMQNPSDGNTEKNTKDVKGSVAISGGNVEGLWLEPSKEFTAAITGGHIAEVGYFQSSEGRNLTGFVSGGTFDNPVIMAYCAEGYIPTTISEDVYGVKEGTVVAYIKLEDGTEKCYEATVAAALSKAQSGETVILNTSAKELNVLAVTNGITLDLNGNELEAAYVVAFGDANIVDNSTNKAGLLKVAKNSISLSKDNAQMPVYNGINGYRFATMKMTQIKMNSATEDSFEFKFKPSFGTEIAKLLKDGCEDNDIKISVVLTWEETNGTKTLPFVYGDEYVNQVYGTSNAFLYTCTGLKSMELAGKISAVIIVESSLGIQATSTVINPWL